MKHVIAALFFVLLSLPAHAAIEVGTGDIPVGAPAPPGGSSPSGGQCDFEGIKHSLYTTESGNGSGYTTPGPMTKYGQARGKYQFVEETQNNMLKKHPECTPNGQNCYSANIYNTECHATQECLMNALLAENYARAKNNKNCQALVGRSVQSSMGSKGACSSQITWSGILAGYHLGGNDACDNVLKGSRKGADGLSEGDNDGHTSEKYYMCYHSGVAVPEQCELPKYDPGTNPPTLTAPQLIFMEDSGDGGATNNGGTIKQNWVAGLMLMAEQFSVNMEAQLKAIGMFFDAKEQAEAQRDFQQRVAEAHKDYQPSEQMCTFGTFSTNLASTQRRADLTRNALSHEVMQRELGTGDSKSFEPTVDILSRIKQFRDKYCSPADNGNGLGNLCVKETEPDMQNKDINYTQTIDAPLTLDVDLTDNKLTNDEETIFALIDYLFAHTPLPRVPKTPLEQMKYQYHYHNLRSIIAMRGIARNSFANIIALKTASPDENSKSGPYLKALMKEMGVEDEEIEKILGKNPSYYAQMEFLTKTLYQNPNFYTALYDKPANVERMRAAMRAIKLMSDRDIHSSLLRREMLLSLILELKLRERAEEVYNDAQIGLYREQ